jgi:hypothetical protein
MSKIKLKEIIKEILREESEAAKAAKAQGLTNMGFGRWGKDGKVTFVTKDGKLVPFEPKAKGGASGQQTPGQGELPQPTAGGQPTQDTPQTTPQDPETARVQQVLPKADLSDAPLSSVASEHLQQVVTRVDKLAQMGQEAISRGEKAPRYNLCRVSIPGTNLFCGANKGISRVEMPQFKGEAIPGSEADKLPKAGNGEVDAEEFFKKMLADEGISVSEPTSVPPDRLRATQMELKGPQVASMSRVLSDRNDPRYANITAPIYVSHDGYVVDGHHRWAAIVAHNAANPDDQLEMQVRVIGEDIEPLIERSNKFADGIGIARKPAGKDDVPEIDLDERKQKTENKAMKSDKTRFTKSFPRKKSNQKSEIYQKLKEIKSKGYKAKDKEMVKKVLREVIKHYK